MQQSQQQLQAQLQREQHEWTLNFLRNGGSVRMLGDIEERDLEVLYSYATQLMATGNFEEAKRILCLLMHLDHWSYDYLLSLGSCYQQTEGHEEALHFFARAGMIRIDSPYPAYHAAHSYQALGNYPYAKKAFNAALRWCHGRTEYDTIASSATASLAELESRGGE